LIIEHPRNSDPSCYSYTRVRGYGDRRLHQRSPLSFERLIFPHNIGENHWICIVVFPKQSLIVAVDSLRMARPLAYARIIFRWLYDETRYHWPEDNTTMFGSHRPDRGWVFRVDSIVSQQSDTWNCGVFALGYVICFLFGMNPNKLKPDLIEDYRIHLFCDLFDEQVLVDPTRIVSHPPPPWASTESGTPSRRIKIKLATLPPSPLSPENALWSTSRRLTLP
jgi:Ulp1 family protease